MHRDRDLHGLVTCMETVSIHVKRFLAYVHIYRDFSFDLYKDLSFDVYSTYCRLVTCCVGLCGCIYMSLSFWAYIETSLLAYVHI